MRLFRAVISSALPAPAQTPQTERAIAAGQDKEASPLTLLAMIVRNLLLSRPVSSFTPFHCEHLP